MLLFHNSSAQDFAPVAKSWAELLRYSFRGWKSVKFD